MAPYDGMVRRLLLRGCAVAGAVSLLAGCSGDPNKGISIRAVRSATVSEVVDGPASVSARASATLTSPAEGRVAILTVKDGQRVAPGTIVAVIDSPSARQRLDQARQAAAAASVGFIRVPGIDLSGVQVRTDAAAAAAFAQSQAAVDKIPDAAARAASQRQLAAAEAQYGAAQEQARLTVRQFNAGLAGLGAALRSVTAAQRAQGQAAVAVAQSTIDSLTLRAPIAGTVQLGGTSAASSGGLSDLLGQLPAAAQGAGSALSSSSSSPAAAPSGTTTAITPGSLVSAGTAVVTLLDVSSLGLSADVDETDVLLVKPGVRARVELDAVPGATYDATVATVDLSPTTSSRGGVSYHVRLTLGAGRTADGAAALVPRPGMSAVAHLLVRTTPDAVAVPASAILRSGARDSVWAVEAGVASRHYVTVGTQGEDMVAITTGVRVGDRVVVAGAERVHSGQKLS